MTLNVLNAVDLPNALRPRIEAVIDEADDRGDLPQRLHLHLREAGAFRMFTPREFGGDELPLTTALDVLERFGRIDASVGLSVWNANFGFVAAMLSEAGAKRIWAQGTEPTLANSGSPGAAERVAGGYILSGRWNIVTGITFADWFIAISLITEGGQPTGTAAGAPDVRLFAVHRDQLSIEQTWNVTGMRGSRSNDVVLKGAFVSSELVAAFLRASKNDRPLYRGFLPTLVSPGCTAVVLGVARSAIDGVTQLVVDRKTLTRNTVTQSRRAQYLIAKSAASVAAARLLLFSAAESLQRSAESNESVTIGQRADLRAVMTHAAETSREAFVAMYELAGSRALYRTNQIEHPFRDGMAALQHANHSAVFLEAAGRVRLGMDPELPLC